MRGSAKCATVALLIFVAPATGAQEEPVAIKPKHVLPVIDSVLDTTSAAARPAGPTDSTAVRANRPSCWRAQPLPACPGFFLTEIGVEAPMLSTSVRGRRGADGTIGPRSDAAMRAVWSFGFMGTAGRNSHGGTFSLTPEATITEPVPIALEYRYRRWMGRSSALDGSLGYRTAAVWKDGVGYARGRGLTAMAGYTFNSYFGVSLRGDVLRAPGGGRLRGALHAGIRSTRLSEEFIRLTAIAIARAALGAIGVEWDDGDSDGQ